MLESLASDPQGTRNHAQEPIPEFTAYFLQEMSNKLTFLLKPHQVSIYCCRPASLDSACPCAAVGRGTGELSNLVLIDLPAGRLKSPGFHFWMDYGI